MAIQPGTIAALRKRADDAKAAQIAAEATAQAAREEHARLLAQAAVEFGVDSEDALAALVTREQAALEQEAAEIDRLLTEAERAAAALP